MEKSGFVSYVRYQIRIYDSGFGYPDEISWEYCFKLI